MEWRRQLPSQIEFGTEERNPTGLDTSIWKRQAKRMNVIPWLAILVATVVCFFLGGRWVYPGVFGRAWAREAGVSEDSCKGGAKFKVLGATFVLTLLSTSVLSFCLAPHPGILYGAIAGLVVGLGWVASAIGTNYLYENKTLKLFAITSGYHVVRFLVAGVILGLMQ
jgi:hypothetical protein